MSRKSRRGRGVKVLMLLIISAILPMEVSAGAQGQDLCVNDAFTNSAYNQRAEPLPKYEHFPEDDAEVCGAVVEAFNKALPEKGGLYADPIFLRWSAVYNYPSPPTMPRSQTLRSGLSPRDWIVVPYLNDGQYRFLLRNWWNINWHRKTSGIVQTAYGHYLIEEKTFSPILDLNGIGGRDAIGERENSVLVFFRSRDGLVYECGKLGACSDLGEKLSSLKGSLTELGFFPGASYYPKEVNIALIGTEIFFVFREPLRDVTVVVKLGSPDDFEMICRIKRQGCRD